MNSQAPIRIPSSCKSARTIYGDCIQLSEPEHPLFSATIIVSNKERWPNLDPTIKSLITFPWIREIIVWNNNQEENNMKLNDIIKWTNVSDFPIRIINSVENVGTLGRYLACKQASFDNCLVMDDDWFPVGLSSLRASYVLSEGQGIHVITDAMTSFMDRSYRFFTSDNTKTRFGFAWVGVAACFSRFVAVTFLSLWGEISILAPDLIKLRGSEDFCFTIFYQKDYPITLETSIVPLAKNDAEFAMSNVKNYTEFQKKSYFISRYAAFRFRDKISAAFSEIPPPSYLINYRTAAHSVSPIILLNSREYAPLPIELHNNSKLGVDLMPDSNTCDGTDQSVLLDNNLKTCWEKKVEMRGGDFLGLQMAWNAPIESAIITMKSDDSLILDALYGGCLESCFLTRDSFMHDAFNNTKLQRHCILVKTGLFQVRDIDGFTKLKSLQFFRAKKKRVSTFLLRFASSHGCNQLYKLERKSQTLCEFEVLFKQNSYFETNNNIPMLPTSIDKILNSVCTGTFCKVHDKVKENDNVKLHRKLVIGITTTASTHGFDFRMAARHTWMRFLRSFPDVSVKFLLGPANTMPKNVIAESDSFDDILFFDRDVTYSTLLDRTLDFYRWVVRTYDTEMIMKMNDDTYLNLFEFMFHLNTIEGHFKTLYFGFFFEKQEVYHDPNHRNYEPMLPNLDFYLPYASGAGYVVGVDIVNMVLINPNVKFSHLRNEDAAVGGAIRLMPPGNVFYHHVQFIQLWPPDKAYPSFVLIHGLCPSQFDLLYWMFATKSSEVKLDDPHVCKKRGN